MALDSNGLLLQLQHPKSLRWAIFEDDGICAYLYLTEKGRMEPIRDVWVYNRIEAPATEYLSLHQDSPPPAIAGYASEDAHIESITEDEIHIAWSADGESASVAIRGTTVALVSFKLPSGYCRNLTNNGPWGRTWNPAVFKALFGKQTS